MEQRMNRGVLFQVVKIPDPNDLTTQVLVLDDATKAQVIEHLERQDWDDLFEYSIAAYDWDQMSESGPERLGSIAGDEFMAHPDGFPI